MQKHFVTFFSPGTFVAETTERPIESWNVDEAVRLSKNVEERYSATPYGFQFSTRERGDNDLDSHEVKRSPMYYLGGKVLTAEEVLSGTDPAASILRDNVRWNRIKRVVVNTNSWKVVQPLNDDDVVLTEEGKAPSV